VRLEKERSARAKALHAKYDQFLAQAQSQLTQHQRLDDALLVKARREESRRRLACGDSGDTGSGGRRAAQAARSRPSNHCSARSRTSRRQSFQEPEL